MGCPGDQGEVLIETLWNVNMQMMQQFMQFKQVLIETLWNVNVDTVVFNALRAFVLIETLWNVNLMRHRHSAL